MSLRRLRQMSIEEIAHRLRETFRRSTDLMRFRSGVRIEEDPELDALVARCSSSLKDYLRNEVAPRFYPSTQNREGITNFIKKECPDWFDRALGDGGFCANTGSICSVIPMLRSIDTSTGIAIRFRAINGHASSGHNTTLSARLPPTRKSFTN